MNIAFFSYEFPPETGGGGIGSYLKLVTRLIRQRGHTVTVFTATKKDKAWREDDFVLRIPASGWQEFNRILPEYFLPVHEENPFDIAECTDFCGCGLYVKKKLPGLPVVVKLHTPLYMVDRLLFNPMPFLKKLRFMAGALRRLQVPKLPQFPRAIDYQEEFELIKLAERISSPGHSIYNEMIALGFDLENKTDFLALPFEISPDLRKIKARPEIRKDPQIIFIGRMEGRKGVIDLAKAIPLVLKVYPHVHFTFVGEASMSPLPGIDMITYLKRKLKKYPDAVTFTGRQSHDKVVEFLSSGDIFVFPSHYESFGLACCEAMAAGKAVIGSKEGGMAEIIEDELSGLLVNAKDPKNLASTMIKLIHDDQLRLDLGLGGRKRIREFLDPGKIIESQISCYQHAIDLCKTSSSSLLDKVETVRND
jgi:glycosyltransferase involved in cell wall biosynthesis